MILLKKAQQVEAAGDLAWESGNEAEGERLDNERSALWAENERRLEEAKALFNSYDEEARDSGWLNAAETTFDDEQTETFNVFGAEALYMCEFWEAAAESAQSIVDFR